MALLDSPLNKAGKLLIYIHTAKHVLVEVHPSLRVPRTFKRFAGLCVELLQRQKIRAAGANETLMKVVSNPVEKYLPPGSRRFGMSVNGRQVKMRDFAAQLEEQASDSPLPIVFCIGLGSLVIKAGWLMAIQSPRKTLGQTMWRRMYREAWIKNRTLGRPVPAPVQGVVVGPCVDQSQPKAKAPAPPVDLLDMGTSNSSKPGSKPAEETDLLNFGSEPVKEIRRRGDGEVMMVMVVVMMAVMVPPGHPSGHFQETKSSDLLATGAGTGGDLLGLSASPVQADDLLSAMGGAPLDFGAQQVATPAVPSVVPASPAPQLSSLDFQASAPAQVQAPHVPMAPHTAPMNGNTLAAGAKLVEQPKEKAEDPFAMALKQWGM
eukprot:symbB.v1.2.003758.t1/scaffold207.1/size268535/5